MKSSMAVAYAMKRKAKKMADGGGVSDSDSDSASDQFVKGFKEALGGMAMGGEVVDRIMSKRKNMSEGGKVANSTTVRADELPAEYDDLVLRDDLESHYTGENSGDMIGDEREDADREDIVRRIMASRRKRDSLPSPR